MLEPLRSFGAPTNGSIGPLSYLQMQSVTGEAPSGRCLHTRGGFIRELSDAAIDAMVESAARNPSPGQVDWLDHYHGAMCRMAQDATAFSVRETGYGFHGPVRMENARRGPQQTAWVDQTSDAMAPFAADIVYVASLGDEASIASSAATVRITLGSHAQAQVRSRQFFPVEPEHRARQLALKAILLPRGLLLTTRH